MLKDFFPSTYPHYSAFPVFGAFLDDYSDWLLNQGYQRSTVQLYIRSIPVIEKYCVSKQINSAKDLTPEFLAGCRNWFVVHNQPASFVVRTLHYFLQARCHLAPPIQVSPSKAQLCIQTYTSYLREVRGLACRTVKQHQLTITDLLEFLTKSGDELSLEKLIISDVESFLLGKSATLCRASLQHIVAQLRGFLRFLITQGILQPSFNIQIDTPRLYRQEKLPRSLPWDTVLAFLASIDRTQPGGLRDYAMFLLMSTYGIRNCDVVSLTLDNIQWRKGIISLVQRKTSQPLHLPLTDVSGTAIEQYLHHGRQNNTKYREIFLRIKAPVKPMGCTAVSAAFSMRATHSGLKIPFYGACCLRHSYAIHLLRQGTSLKVIGDLLGHRSFESTCVYLRLDFDELREVALPVPCSEGGL